ncbi:MAG: class I SAM-dependent methyltransferase [Candidatus Omnitrophica bacterium]|nr:class I SAM-dependent methyltransferase [Candidatus Omnitrophota bacterium]
MMEKDDRKIGINKALKCFGGFVRYYDTTEPLTQIIALVSTGDYRNILACCGGGDQALTMLGAGGGRGSLWVVDINPAQLFVLAAKASFLKKNNLMPSFEQLHRAYPGRITAFKKNIRCLRQMCFYNTVTGRMIAPPDSLAEKYSIATDNGMFCLPESGPFWQKDPLFTARVRARLGRLHFARMDIFDSPDYFKQGSLDLIYMSDIFWPEALTYYQAKLARVAGLLRPGGRIITYLDAGDDFMGEGVSPGRMLAQQARTLALKMDTDNVSGGYLVFERMRRGE